MDPVPIRLASILTIVLLIWMDVYIPSALGLVSFIVSWVMHGNIKLWFGLTKMAIGDSPVENTFATIPPFVFMGLMVSKDAVMGLAANLGGFACLSA